MTESSTPPVHENDNETLTSSSPWVMLISMLLLIAGLILSSAMLFHYALNGKEKKEGTSLFNFTRFMGAGKNWAAGMKPAHPENPSTSETSQPQASDSQESVVTRLLSSDGDGAVRWPKLKLTGFGKANDAEGSFAIINGKQVLVNTYIGDVKLIEIRTHGAVVEYKGEQKILTVD